MGIVKNSLLSTAGAAIASKGLQVANQSFKLVKGGSAILSPSKILGPYLLATTLAYATKAGLDKLTPDRLQYDPIVVQLKALAFQGVRVGALVALTGPAGAAVSLIESLALVYLSNTVTMSFDAVGRALKNPHLQLA